MSKLFKIFIITIFTANLSAGILDMNPIHTVANFQRTGARARGMGQAFTAVADDASALNWNPAGLSQLYLPELSYEGNLNLGSFKNTFNENEISQEQSLGYNTAFVGFALPIPSVDFGGFDPSDLAITLAASYNRLDAYNGDFTYDSSLASYVSENLDYKQSGGLDAFSFGGSIRLVSALSLGMKYNIYGGTSEVDYNDGELSDIKFDYEGKSIQLGALFKPNEVVAIGAKFNLPKTITQKADGVNFEEADYDIPMYSTVGIAFFSSSGMTLAFDYVMRPSDEIEMKTINETTQTDLMQDNLNSIHVGLETVSPQGATLRLGYYYEPTKLYINNEQMKNHNITGGVGFLLGQNFALDFAGEWKFFREDLNDSELERDLFNFGIGATYYIGK